MGKWTSEAEAEAKRLLADDGLTLAQIAETVGVSYLTLRKYLWCDPGYVRRANKKWTSEIEAQARRLLVEGELTITNIAKAVGVSYEILHFHLGSDPAYINENRYRYSDPKWTFEIEAEARRLLVEGDMGPGEVAEAVGVGIALLRKHLGSDPAYIQARSYTQWTSAVETEARELLVDGGLKMYEVAETIGVHIQTLRRHLRCDPAYIQRASTSSRNLRNQRWTAEMEAEARRLLADGGLKIYEVARVVGVSYPTLRRHLRSDPAYIARASKSRAQIDL